MAYLTTALQTQAMTAPCQLRFGERAISIHKDFRKRFYQTNPIIECHAGSNAGHLEILLFRHWLVVFSRARKYSCIKH